MGEVELGENASVWMNAVLRGDVHSIRVGANSNVQDCAVLHGMRHKHPVDVGDWVTIGHNATVHGCVIEDACLIGMGARILNNARIGEGSIIAAGALVLGEHSGAAEHTLGGCASEGAAQAGAKRPRGILQYARNYVDYTATYLKERENWYKGKNDRPGLQPSQMSFRSCDPGRWPGLVWRRTFGAGFPCDPGYSHAVLSGL